MKKIFTCISLAALSLVAANPVAAQQRQVSDQEKVAFVKAVVPAMLEQVNQISGIDIVALANPNIETVLSSPLFGTQSMLRASAPKDISIQPDSMKLNLSEVDMGDNIPSFAKPFLADIKLTFAEYKEFTVTTADARTIKINVPCKISASALGGVISCGINLTIGDKAGLLPFNSFVANLDLGSLEGMLAQFAPELKIKSGKLFSMTEKGTNGAYTYDIEIGEALRGLEQLSSLPNFQITVDMAAMLTKATIGASLYGVIPNAKLPMGDAMVYLNPAMAAKGTMFADSTILTSYKTGTANVSGYKRIIVDSQTVSAKKVQNHTHTYTKEKKEDAWAWASHSMNELNNNTGIDSKNLVSSIINGIFADLMSGTAKSFNMVSTTYNGAGDSKGITTMTLDVAPSMMGTQAAVIAIKMKTFDKEANTLAESMNIKLTMPTKDQTMAIEFTPTEFKAPVGILYVKSNAMGIITDNETIESNEVTPLQVIPTTGGLQVKNGKGSFVIVNMVGKPMATGTINNDEQYLATPNMPKGIYMISITQRDADRSTHKTTVKFVK